jgi:hypothetical protein
MEPLSQDDLPLGALTPKYPLWRAAAKAMGRWAPAPKLTDESARLYCRCKAPHGRASAKLFEAESTKKRDHSSGASVETALWLAPKTNFKAAATSAGGDIQLPSDVAPYRVSAAMIEEQAFMGCELDFDNYVVIGQACPRTRLGMGVSQVVLKVKAVDRVTWKVAVPPDEIAPVEDTVHARVSTTSTLPAVEAARLFTPRRSPWRGDLDESCAFADEEGPGVGTLALRPQVDHEGAPRHHEDGN